MPTALPDFVSEISGMLVALLPVAALGAMVLAGLRLRGEGGINYDAGGGFFKWLAPADPTSNLFCNRPGAFLWWSSPHSTVGRWDGDLWFRCHQPHHRNHELRQQCRRRAHCAADGGCPLFQIHSG